LRLTGGKLGIGTYSTGPEEKLHVAGNAKVNGDVIAGTGSSTATRPCFTFSGDADTGTWSPGANQWAVSTGGVERLRVRDSGMVQFFKPISIGTTPSSQIGIFNYVSVVGSGSGGITGITNLPNITGATTGDCRVYDAAVNLNGSVGNLYLYKARSSISGTGSVSGEVVGFEVENLPSSFGVSQFGVKSELSAGANRWNIYADGTAPNYFAGQVQTGLGTASEPSVSILGNEDTGTFSPGAGNWAVSTGGVERLRVRADGNVGIGSSGDSATRLKIAGTTASYGVRMDVGASASSSTYDGILVVSSSAGDSVTGSSSGIRIAGSGAVCDNFRGINVTSVPASTTNLCAGVSASVSAGNNRWAFYADGGADSFSAGNWRFAVGKGVESSTGQASTQFPDNDKFAISAGGIERLRVDASGDLLAATGYTPANDQSLATKKYVDDNSGTYVLPIATNSILGGVKIGSGLEIDAGGVASAKAQFQVLTQAEYDNIGTPDPDVLYLISG